MPRSDPSNNKPQTKAKQQHEQNLRTKDRQNRPRDKQQVDKQLSVESSGEDQEVQEHAGGQQQEKQGPDNEQAPEPESKQQVSQGQAFMLPQQRQYDRRSAKYHFCRFISRHYRLIQDKRGRKNHFVRLQPVFTRFLHVLKLQKLSLITIDGFRRYLKKFFKRRGIKYEETTNRVDMKVVVGIDRRCNSKFQF